VALAAADGKFVTGSTFLLGLVAMVACLGAVQPRLTGYVVFNFMAVMAADRPGAIIAPLIVAGVAHILVFFKLIVAVLTVDPV